MISCFCIFSWAVDRICFEFEKVSWPTQLLLVLFYYSARRLNRASESFLPIMLECECLVLCFPNQDYYTCYSERTSTIILSQTVLQWCLHLVEFLNWEMCISFLGLLEIHRHIGMVELNMMLGMSIHIRIKAHLQAPSLSETLTLLSVGFFVKSRHGMKANKKESMNQER